MRAGGPEPRPLHPWDISTFNIQHFNITRNLEISKFYRPRPPRSRKPPYRCGPSLGGVAQEGPEEVREAREGLGEAPGEIPERSGEARGSLGRSGEPWTCNLASLCLLLGNPN